MTRIVVRMILALCLATCAVHPRSAEAAAAPTHAEVARLCSDLMIRDYPPTGPGAAVLVARGDTVLFRGARGEADVATHAALLPGSVFRIGSVGKQFTAAALLTLVEAGRVRLDDSLSRYLPDYPGGSHITILTLLNHTSGVRSYSSLPRYADSTIRLDFTTAQIIGLFRNEPPDFAPGTNWAYSNSGYALIGAVIETVTGMPWHAYLEQKLFKPLGMRHTGYAHDPRFAGPMVRGYSLDGEKVVPMRPMSMTQPHAAGALVSNVDDLLTWNRALHQGRVLRSDAYTQMITPTGKAADPGIRYGFGLYDETVRGRQMLRHGGRIFGFIASLSYLPGPDITVVVLENDDAHDGVEVAEVVSRRLAAIALDEPYPVLAPVAADTAALRAAEGIYRFNGDITRTLRVIDGRLTGQRTNRPPVVLTPIATDDFLYADGFNRLKLERDAGGAIVRVRFFPNGDGDGEIGTRTNEAPAEPRAMQLPRAALSRLVGTYANSQVAVTVFLEGDALKAQIAGQSPFVLRATSPTQFALVDNDATLLFASGSAPADTLTVRQNGRATTLRRAP
jgi:D-alanyl-D-alanine carboxypeptidase